MPVSTSLRILSHLRSSPASLGVRAVRPWLGPWARHQSLPLPCPRHRRQGRAGVTAESPPLRATAVTREGQPFDTVTLTHDDRHRRRIRLTTDSGTPFLLDLAEAQHLADGDLLALEDGRYLQIRAALEPVLEVEAVDTDRARPPRLAPRQSPHASPGARAGPSSSARRPCARGDAGAAGCQGHPLRGTLLPRARRLRRPWALMPSRSPRSCLRRLFHRASAPS